MRGSDECCSRFGATANAFFDVQAIVIYRHGRQVVGYSAESFNRARIARLLDPDLVRDLTAPAQKALNLAGRRLQ
jgi:hypothetical protein